MFRLATSTVRYHQEAPPLSAVPVRLAAGAFSRLQPGTSLPPLPLRYQSVAGSNGKGDRTAA